MNKQTTYFSSIGRKIAALMMLFAFSHAVMAVDGIIIKSKSSKASFSNMKKNLTLSLHSGYAYRDNRSFGFRKVSKESSFNSIIAYQKGNITYVLPYKNKAVLQKFKTPQKPLN
ncbi:MAG: hypothetical protein RL131_80 [Bacteroidota bacterium]|jgi:hypothetical protein